MESNPLFNDLLTALDTAEKLKAFIGREPGAKLGIVVDREDPLNLGRIRATVSNLGAKTETDWLYRLEPCGGLSLPVPQRGDTVLILYKDGDPHQGIYLGVLQNALNPAGAKDSLIFKNSDSTLAITPNSIVFRVGDTQLALSDGSVTINNKQIATIGAEDTRQDTLVTKGWE